ncbi:MAG: endopeptidase La [Proteobacteria bacterium]|nr:endopeptidase La [Pseudomonadota bacterium]
MNIPARLPVLAAKDLVAFPSVMMSLHVTREASIAAVERAMETDKLIFIVAQQDQSADSPAAKDLHKVGVVGNVIRTLQLPDGRYKVLVQGLERARAKRYEDKSGVLTAYLEILPSHSVREPSGKDVARMNRIRENLQLLVQHEQRPEEILLVTEEINDPGVLADVIVAHYNLDAKASQSLLEELDPRKRLQATDDIIADDLNQFFISEQIKDKAQTEMNKGQREYYLREQIRQINRELGEAEGQSEDLAHLKEVLDKAKLPPHAKQEADKQVRRLEKMQPEASEYALIRTYLDWLAEIPWSIRTRDQLQIGSARGILDEDHFGLEKAKERILEYLSVLKLKRDSRGPILCFVGPPGVGKTSLGKSIARALGRKFVRVSVGGVRDEAEIRGHRRTYVGALPGRVIQGMKQAGSKNCVFVLDELDKVGADFRGDPASALLEVLDPQQNQDFIDHYLGVAYDLSEVLFIATANTLDTIPDALLDRLEVIYISGYTTEEKVKIAQRFLVPRQQKENGLANKKVAISEEALLFLIERYTREAGVRSLEREIGSLFRKIAREFVEKKQLPKRLDEEAMKRLLGPTKFDPEVSEIVEQEGVVRGLAWTVHGGELMPIEVSIAKGSGQLQLTGQLGAIMQESAQAALFYSRANAKMLGLDPDFHQKYDIHIHVPGGATPKDGPSAGITIATAVVSALAKRSVSKEIAMTGEITLRGNVLPVGGLKEKALAALRYGITKVIIPFENIKDLEDIPKEQRDRIKFIPVKHIGEVLKIALLQPMKPKSAKKGPARKRRTKPSLRAEV